MLRVEPKAPDKYCVRISGKAYPPKQILAKSLGLPLISFTTVDANRVLTKLGFEIQEIGEKPQQTKTDSERLFEEYLLCSGVTEFYFEKELVQTSRKPDFYLPFQGGGILFEVKEFRATENDFKPGAGAYDPYHPIREKINEGRKKFQNLKGKYCCCLVLFNRDKPLVDLGWQFIYGSMLGNMAIQLPLNLVRGERVGDPKSGFFGGGGKMVRYREGKAVEPQNTTISAILVLEQFNIGMRRFEVEVAREEQRLGKSLSLQEHSALVNRSSGTERDISLRQLRLVIHENPYTESIPFPQDLFNGQYDERYGLVEDRIERIFAGEEIRKLDGSLGGICDEERRS